MMAYDQQVANLERENERLEAEAVRLHLDLGATARLAETQREALEWAVSEVTRLSRGVDGSETTLQKDAAARNALALTPTRAMEIAKAEKRAAGALEGALRGWAAAEDSSNYYGGGRAEEVAPLRVEAEAALRDLDAAREGGVGT